MVFLLIVTLTLFILPLLQPPSILSHARAKYQKVLIDLQHKKSYKPANVVRFDETLPRWP